MVTTTLGLYVKLPLKSFGQALRCVCPLWDRFAIYGWLILDFDPSNVDEVRVTLPWARHGQDNNMAKVGYKHVAIQKIDCMSFSVVARWSHGIYFYLERVREHEAWQCMTIKFIMCTLGNDINNPRPHIKGTMCEL